MISSAFLASFTRPFANPLRLTISGPPFVPRPRLSPHIIPNWNRGMRLSLTQSLTFILKTNSANEPRRRWVQLRFRLPMICSRELPLSSRSTRDSLSCLKSSVLMHVVMQCDFVSYLPPRVKQPALSFDYSSIAINTHLSDTPPIQSIPPVLASSSTDSRACALPTPLATTIPFRPLWLSYVHQGAYRRESTMWRCLFPLQASSIQYVIV